MADPHKLPDDLLATPALQERFFLESLFEGERQRKLGYWHLRQRSNGDFSRKAVRYVPEPGVVRMSEILLGNINKKVGMGGAWVLAWMNEGDKLVLMWMDGDGDVQFTYELDAQQIFHPVPSRRMELNDIVNHCYESWKAWRFHMVEVLDSRPGIDTYRRALGEKPPTAR